jgi:hypothetical protein
MRSIVGAACMGSILLLHFVCDFFTNVTKIPRLCFPVHEFLEDYKIGEEFIEPLNDRFILNVTALRAIQKRMPNRQEDVALDHVPESVPSMDEVRR